ncbi:MAG: O-antigen ligase family protein [Oscillatoriophycideae cyanobacterium NC_groundwater_1537_Pr4_S-0.65um_50_18]|nr:O-antigen ligase family protein [Oscillatoriophycideae cyanobacterium NC_groundwater_1537_Pr4_S-0.65um_50_18]
MVLKLAEKIFVVIVVLFYSKAFADFIPETHPFAPFKEVLAYAGFAVTLFLITRRWKKVACIVLKEKLLWILVALVIASISWSDLPLETLNRVMPLLRVTMFGIYFATRFSIKEQMQLLAWMFGAAAILSILFAVALPQYGIVGLGFISNMEDIVHTGTWRGIYVHKTILGTMMALGSLVFMFCSIVTSRFRWVMLIGAGLCLAVLLISTTKGALAILLIVLILLPFCRALRWNFTIAVPFFILVTLIGGVLVVLLTVNAEQALGSLGRDVTLTGRTDYWPLMLNKIWERPWLGYGYKTFWVGGWKGEPADIWRFLAPGNEPPHAHNGFLNLWFDIGLLGLVVFTVGFIVNYLRAIAWVRITKTAEGFVPIAYLSFLFLVNLTESFLLEPELFWMLYVSLILSMHHKSSHQRNDLH